ncbi:xanthine dehydrogenase accessory protein XdhC [Sphingomonas sp.]|jgi:xanthine dehydrogenase accessory factor|uniref:xanthine dehydrogenase accessory protein XdhC n=1 Tax=Sphingomonas sp. TaxID=28214 RepID=UPI002E2F1F5E|nr:xanthine dehydrogenase accessory protein XdhC [Sphingomonas sp.]HEX4695217.1 xanthine dehydrogenase accessory protein XdhC [Sphingomonas sp.]
MIPDWLEALRAARGHEPVALVTILSTEGSAPRRAGTRMAVTGGESIGTIGGGALEHQAIDQARRLLAEPPGSWRVQDWPLGPLLGQCCGGQVRLMIEHVDADPERWDWTDYVERRKPIATFFNDGKAPVTRFPAEHVEAGVQPPLPPRSAKPAKGTIFIEPDDRRPERPLLMFGAGHVGVAIAARLPRLPFRLAWFDSRQNRAIPGVSLQDEDAMAACAGEAEDGAAVLIFTHDHALDYRLTAAALRSPARFVGLIGSETKRARFLSRLKEDGADASRLTCPIGVAGIPDKHPDVIAIAVIAQLLTLAPDA